MIKQRELVAPLIITAVSLLGIAARVCLYFAHGDRAITTAPKTKIVLRTGVNRDGAVAVASAAGAITVTRADSSSAER